MRESWLLVLNWAREKERGGCWFWFLRENGVVARGGFGGAHGAASSLVIVIANGEAVGGGWVGLGVSVEKKGRQLLEWKCFTVLVRGKTVRERR
ncbi:hypothetical protein D5086_033468 [Populus alba]|uniref:Uncharacterized protein n=1 Tax=Populus alba TaxID=43335 RepID=A0ACC4AGX8_POPAL